MGIKPNLLAVSQPVMVDGKATVPPKAVKAVKPAASTGMQLPPLDLKAEPVLVAGTPHTQLVPPPAVGPNPSSPLKLKPLAGNLIGQEQPPHVGAEEREHVAAPPAVKEPSLRRLEKQEDALHAEVKALKQAKAIKKYGALSKEKPAALHYVSDNGVFGVPKNGVWTGGDSNWGQPDEPWRDDDASWPPAAASSGPGTSLEVLEQVKAKEEVKVGPWEGDAEAAPWEKDQKDQPPRPAPAQAAPSEELLEQSSIDSGSLLQTAAQSCAARKLEQHTACKKAEADAEKECGEVESCDQRDSAHKFCDRTAKATLKACFDEWKKAKAQ